MKNFLLIAVLCFLHANMTAQSLRSYERAGDEAFQNKNYGAALQLYGDVLKRRTDDLALWWKYGESARLNSAFREAERAYKKISSANKQKEKYALLDFRLAEVKKQLGEYDVSIALFEQFLKTTPAKADTQFFQQARTEIANCQTAKTIVSNPTGVEIKHMGRAINSPWNEFAPTVLGDTLFFSSNRFDKKGEKGRDKAKLHKIMIAAKNGRGREPGKGFPTTDTAHIAHTAFSPDGHYMFFTVCKDRNALDKHCELWLTVIDRRNRWLPPVRLPEPINLPGYTTTQPNVGFDEDVQGPVLWFASDRPGGKGKLDLWSLPLDTNFFCPCNLPVPGKKIIQLPDFQKPVNALELNTPENDGTPFFFAPTQQLYFSSDGLPGLGGFDVFYASKKGTGFSEPINAGAGINTSFNDHYFFLKNDGRNGYLSSNRPGSYFVDERTKAACHDIYSFKLPEPEEPKPAPSDSTDTYTTKTPEHPNEELPTLPPVQPPKLADFNGLPLYFDNDEPDTRTRRTTTTRPYDDTVLGYLERQNEYRERFTERLMGEAATKAEVQVDDFFENEVRRGYEQLGSLCELLLSRLQSGDEIEVLLKGFTSPRAQHDYNLNLGKRRVSSVRNQFESWGDGALQAFLRDGKLIITELSLGETTARTGISDQLSDERNSIYHPDAARERRVEIVEVRERK